MRRCGLLRLDHRPIVLELLEQMANYNRILRDPHRTMAYQNAITAIKAHAAASGPLLSVDQLKRLPKVGPGTLRRIDEIIRTGHLAEAEKLQRDPRMSQLIHVHGFGPSAAYKFAQKGVTTIAQLRERADSLDLTAAQRIGLKYYDSISQRIPYDEIVQHDHLLQHAAETFSKNALKLVVCGSYRRKLPTSGDVDALLTPTAAADEQRVMTDKDLRLGKFIEYLQCEVQYVIDRLAVGETKFMGVAALPGGSPRRVDIRFVTHAQFPTALLYFTGSKGFNVNMRSIALEKGLTLNEYGLYKVGTASEKSTGLKKNSRQKTTSKDLATPKGQDRKAPDTTLARIPVTSEKEIFDAIGMKFVEPQDRV
jgi:DNA polymerase beta